jgi:hypothetical protein
MKGNLKFFLPVGALTALQQGLAHLLHPDEPGRHCLVDERSLRPPAEWVTVVDSSSSHKPTIVPQHFDDALVCLFHVEAFEVLDRRHELATGVHRTDDILLLGDNSSCQAHPVIVFTEVRRLVNNSCSRIFGNIAVIEHLEGTFCLQLWSKNLLYCKR